MRSKLLSVIVIYAFASLTTSKCILTCAWTLSSMMHFCAKCERMVNNCSIYNGVF